MGPERTFQPQTDAATDTVEMRLNRADLAALAEDRLCHIEDLTKDARRAMADTVAADQALKIVSLIGDAVEALRDAAVNA